MPVVISKVKMLDVANPPSITMASGRCISLPTPLESSNGRSPNPA